MRTPNCSPELTQLPEKLLRQNYELPTNFLTEILFLPLIFLNFKNEWNNNSFLRILTLLTDFFERFCFLEMMKRSIIDKSINSDAPWLIFEVNESRRTRKVDELGSQHDHCFSDLKGQPYVAPKHFSWIYPFKLFFTYYNDVTVSINSMNIPKKNPIECHFFS